MQDRQHWVIRTGALFCVGELGKIHNFRTHEWKECYFLISHVVKKEELKEWWQPCLVGASLGLGIVDELHAPTGRDLRLRVIGLADWFFGRVAVAGH